MAISILIAAAPAAVISLIGHLARASGDFVLLAGLGAYGLSLALVLHAGHRSPDRTGPSGQMRLHHAESIAFQRPRGAPTHSLAVHRTILVVDVEGFGDIHRTNVNQLAVRAGLYGSLEKAFGRTGIRWEGCDREDRGDGAFILVPPGVAKALLAESLPAALATALRMHNEAHPPQERIRLRMALHAGEVSYDSHGVTAASVNLAFRLLDAPALKASLAGSPGVLALIVSSWFFDEVVRHSPRSHPAAYRPVNVVVKETRTDAWMCLPDFPFPQEGDCRPHFDTIGAASGSPSAG